MTRLYIRMLSVAMAAAMLLMIIPLSVVSAETEGNYEYTVVDGEATITKYNGSPKELTIPNTLGGYPVTAIGKYAFAQCQRLINVTIPDSVTTIGENAFSLCYDLTNITIPDSVTSIGEGAFYACKKLETVTLSKNLTAIEESTFSSCKKLTSITIPEGVTSIGRWAFNECDNLKSVKLPVGLITIEHQAFYRCDSLDSIVIPEGVTSIGPYVFYECYNLTSIALPRSLTSIGDYALSSCPNIQTIYYSGSRNEWNNITLGLGNERFHQATKVYNTVLGSNEEYEYVIRNNEEIIITKYIGSDTQIVVPDTIEGLPVATIGESAFYGLVRLTSITFPDSITTMNDFALGACDGLTSVTLPKNLINIGDSVLANCTALENVTIPDTVTTISNSMFANCTGLTSITIPGSVTSIGDFAFVGCTGLTSITIPDSVTTIGVGAFNGCVGLTSITLPEWTRTIEKLAFANCSNLTEITIPSIVSTIGDQAFNKCSNLRIVKIFGDVETIGYGTFQYCSKLRVVMLPDSVTSIDSTAFDGCALSHIFFEGTQEQWETISSELSLESVTCHCEVTNKAVLTCEEDEAQCIEWGAARYICTICEETVFADDHMVAPIGHHEFDDDTCRVCDIALAEYLCSDHPYAENTDETKSVVKDGAVSVSVTFSEDTFVENGLDFIYIYDKDDVLIGTYTGTQLAGKTITVNGDTVKVRLVSDDAENGYGYAVTSATARAFLLGDIDGNGTVNMRDVMTIFAAVSKGRALTEEQQLLADYDGNGTVNIRDVMALFKVLAKG